MNKSFESFEDLNAYKIAREVRKEIADLSQTFPKHEEYRLKDQIIRSTRSATANIAEGHGRHYFKENIKFCIMSRGSMNETIDHLTVALDHNYINENTYNLLRDKIKTNIKVLNGYIGYLKTLSGKHPDE
jgi:four helix bundle protein